MSGIFDLPGNVASGPLTKDDFRAAAKAIKSAPPRKPCQHAVNPRAIYRPGWYRCGNCGAPVHVEYPLAEQA